MGKSVQAFAYGVYYFAIAHPQVILRQPTIDKEFAVCKFSHRVKTALRRQS
jgi:hypothetical protein